MALTHVRFNVTSGPGGIKYAGRKRPPQKIPESKGGAEETKSRQAAAKAKPAAKNKKQTAEEARAQMLADFHELHGLPKKPLLRRRKKPAVQARIARGCVDSDTGTEPERPDLVDVFVNRGLRPDGV